MIIYPIGTSGQRLVFSNGVLAHFRKHRQTRWWQREAGGQLFARFSQSEILVDEVTGPRRTDWRTRCSYRPHRAAEQREIDARHRDGFHFVGDWHTHPEPVPAPSPRDLSSIAEMVVQSHHALNGFLLVIVGQLEPPLGLFTGISNGRQLVPLATVIEPPITGQVQNQAQNPMTLSEEIDGITVERMAAEQVEPGRF